MDVLSGFLKCGLDCIFLRRLAVALYFSIRVAKHKLVQGTGLGVWVVADSKGVIAPVGDDNQVCVGVVSNRLEEQVISLVCERIGLGVTKDAIDVFLVYLQNDMSGHTDDGIKLRSEEHMSELQSILRISNAVFFFTKKNK